MIRNVGLACSCRPPFIEGGRPHRRLLDRLRQLRRQRGGAGEDGDLADAGAEAVRDFEDKRRSLGGGRARRDSGGRDGRRAG
jgi:hypothetical protein